MYPLFLLAGTKTKFLMTSRLRTTAGLAESQCLWRRCKTKPEWDQGRQPPTKQETLTVRSGIPRLEPWGGCQLDYQGNRKGPPHSTPYTHGMYRHRIPCRCSSGSHRE